MNTEKPFIIKIGGSVLTDKLSKGGINYQAISELSEVLARVHEPLVLIHGAGSLGHPEAKKWGIAGGVTPENLPGIYETHEAVSSLNRAVVKMLREDGINAVSFPPFAAAFATGRRLRFAGEKQITALLTAGITPVLYGDTVMDSVQGVCIVSGDQLVQYLARMLGASRVGIVTSIGGVLKEGTIVPEITLETLDGIEFTDDSGPDVTGNMKSKVAELLELANAGIPSRIFAPAELPVFLAGGDPGTGISAGGRP